MVGGCKIIISPLLIILLASTVQYPLGTLIQFAMLPLIGSRIIRKKSKLRNALHAPGSPWTLTARTRQYFNPSVNGVAV